MEGLIFGILRYLFRNDVLPDVHTQGRLNICYSILAEILDGCITFNICQITVFSTLCQLSISLIFDA